MNTTEVAEENVFVPPTVPKTKFVNAADDQVALPETVPLLDEVLLNIALPVIVPLLIESLANVAVPRTVKFILKVWPEAVPVRRFVTVG